MQNFIKPQLISETAVQEETTKTSRYVITTAQSDTNVSPLFHTLINYCELTNAELIILPIYHTVAQEKATFAQVLLPYLKHERIILEGSNVQVLGDLKNTATVLNPLSGIKAITRGKTTIIPSTSLMLERVPMPEKDRPLAMWATGCVTLPNYKLQYKSGYKANDLHSFSAIRVEVDSNGDHHIRPLESDSKGMLYDLGLMYQPDILGAKKVNFDMVLGDLHIGSTCPVTIDGFQDLLIKVGKPENLILHDTFDGVTINPHEEKNAIAKFNHPFGSLEEELDTNLANLNAYAEHFCSNELVIVFSNHNDFLNRWIKKVDWRKLECAETAKIYIEAVALALNDQINDFYAIEMIKRGVSDKVLFLKEGEDYSPKGVQCGYHGNNGSGGSKGSIKGFSHLNEPVAIGHRHVSGIYQNCTQVGTFTKLKLGYMSGLQACDNSLAFVYPDGRIQLVELYNGSWSIESAEA